MLRPFSVDVTCKNIKIMIRVHVWGEDEDIYGYVCGRGFAARERENHLRLKDINQPPKRDHQPFFRFSLI